MRSEGADWAAGAEGLLELGATRLRLDFSRFEAFLLLFPGFVFAILRGCGGGNRN